jgi:hypothetical protein
MNGKSEFLRRLVWLSGCIAAGAAVGFAGKALSGSDHWYLAIPAVVAIAWLFVADPSRCGGTSCRNPDRRP